MAIDRTAFNALVNDDGSNTVGSTWNRAAIQSVLLDPIDTALAAVSGAVGVSTVTTTGTITALPLPTGTGDLVIYMNNASLATIQGIAAGLSGQRLTLISMGAGQVDLAHQNAGATAANRLINIATSGNTSLAPATGTAAFVYDATATRWRLVAHDQGAFITPAFAAGNFTASSGTWTVDAGDVTTFAYHLKGRVLTLAFYIATTTVSGGQAFLQIAVPVYTPTKQAAINYWVSDNGTAGISQAQINAGTGTIFLRKDAATNNWSAATNTTAVAGTIAMEVN